MSDDSETPSIDLVRHSVHATRESTLPDTRSGGSGGGGGGSFLGGGKDDGEGGVRPSTRVPDAYEQSVAAAVQSIAQSAAIAIGDATDMMRNAATVQLTTIGAAEAKWIENPTDMTYKEIIDNSITVLDDTVKTFEKIGKSVYSVLKEFDIEGGGGE